MSLINLPNSPALATASAPGAMPATEFAKTSAISQAEADALGQVVTDVISNNGGAAVGDVMIFTDEGVLAAAQADTLAHATGIRGVWSGSRLWRRGEKSIVNFADTPVKGTKCYLSSTAKKAQTAAPTASMVPRMLGFVDRVLTANTAEVFLDYDEDRDNNREWLLETYAPTVDAQSYAFALNPALWKSLRFLGANIGKVDGANIIEIRADSSQSGGSYGWIETSTTGSTSVQTAAYAIGANIGKYDGAGAISYFEAGLRKCPDGTWRYWSIGGGHEITASTSARMGEYIGKLGAVTTNIQLANSVANAFQGNVATVEFFGRVL